MEWSAAATPSGGCTAPAGDHLLVESCIYLIIIFTIHCVAADMNRQISNKIVYEIGKS
jgi:hypothetical protein